MRYRTLHDTDLQVSELGFGTWTLATGWWGNDSDAEAQKLIRVAIEHRFALAKSLERLGVDRRGDGACA